MALSISRISSHGEVKEAKWSIVAALFLIPWTCKAGHCYWILKKDKREAAQLHGLATSKKSKQPVAVGYNENHMLLGLHCFFDPTLSQSHLFEAPKYPFETQTFRMPATYLEKVYTGTDARERWLKAASAIVDFNKKELRYPIFGLCGSNSNSVYFALGKVMGFSAAEIPRFKRYFVPGLNDSLVERFLSQAPSFSPSISDPPPRQIEQKPTQKKKTPSISTSSERRLYPRR